MLNVPETVKHLFKQDGIRKNFRVHFPNGELPDITNDNIAQESVRFTESICSQDVLKFGLTEAPVIEFETVGIANMYGMWIECGIEIDLSSLSAAQIADIAAGTWDGYYTPLEDSDIGFAFFHVPYGVFRVESCPRDHQAMTHRQVQAFGYSPRDLNDNPFEAKKRNALNLPESYQPNMYQFLLEIVGYNMPGTMEREGFAETPVSESMYHPQSTSQTVFSQYFTVKDSNGTDHTLLTSVQYFHGYTEGSGSQSRPRKLTPDSLYSANMNGVSYFTILRNIASALEHDRIGIDLEKSGFASWISLAKAMLTGVNGINYLYPGVSYYPQFESMGGGSHYQKIDIEGDNAVVYPHVNTYTGEINNINVVGIYETFFIPSDFLIDRSTADGGGSVFEYRVPTRASFTRYTRSEPIPDLALTFPQTASGKLAVAGASATGYSYGGNISTPDIINGYIEMFARFGRVNRHNYFEMLRLLDDSPVSIAPAEYSQFWWDEYDVLPIGSIKYTYTDSDNQEAVQEYEFGNGASVYDMTGNALIKAMHISNTTTLEGILASNFVPNLAPIAFTPIDLSMKGLPYIETGDYIAVAAEDGTIAYSFNMRQEISGIQVLTATVESTSGDIIESGESS